MIKESLHWAQISCHARVQATEDSFLKKEFCGVSTDTRQLKAGELFFCLRAQRDGHIYLEEAIQKGAAAIIVDEAFIQAAKQKNSTKKIPTPLIIVKDTLKALGDLAHAWRLKFKIPLLAITGSNGKTTTKELIKALLAPHFNLLVTAGNLNNLIGVPKTLFQLNESHQIAIIEMGMNHLGEIARLTEIAKPNLALITNVAKAHLENFSGIQEIAQAKGELFAGLSAEAIAFVNLQDVWVSQIPTAAKQVGFGTEKSDFWVENFKSQDPNFLSLRAHVKEKSMDLKVRLLGQHNAYNVLAALVLADHFGVSLENIKTSLENFVSIAGRMQRIDLSQGRHLINDCYNANPASMAAALKTLADLKSDQKALAILGDMREVGESSQNEHYRIGELLGQLNIEAMLAVGEYSQSLLAGAQAASNFHVQDNLYACQNNAEAKTILGNKKDGFKGLKLQDFSWILIKGSRANHLEEIVQFVLSF